MQLNNLKFLSLLLAPSAPCSMNHVNKAVVQTVQIVLVLFCIPAKKYRRQIKRQCCPSLSRSCMRALFEMERSHLVKFRNRVEMWQCHSNLKLILLLH